MSLTFEGEDSFVFTFRMSQFRIDGRTFVAAVSFVTWNTSFAASDNSLDIDAGILNIIQRQSLQYLMLLRIANVQVSVSRRDAQIILIRHLSRAARDLFEIYVLTRLLHVLQILLYNV